MAAMVQGAPRPLIGRVVWIVDGDTIHVQIGGRVEQVRYIGVNAPEGRHDGRGWRDGGAEAHAINRRLVGADHVRLELDVAHRDRHGRLLAYVWVERARTTFMANAELVSRGYAQVMTIPPNLKYQEWFRKLEQHARETRQGLWG